MTADQTARESTAPASNELQAAKKTVLSIISAFKAYSLYPDDHAVSRKNLAKLEDDLASFLQEYETLRLDTSRNSFFYKEELLFEGQAEESNPAYLLTRDGLEYIELVSGIPTHEISALLSILNRHRNPFEESGGDIVTSMWQENFSHILYEEVDIFALESFQFDLSSFKVTPAAKRGDAEAGDTVPPVPAHDGPAPDLLGRQKPETAGQENIAAADDSPQPGPLEPLPEGPHNMYLTERGIKLLSISPEEEKMLSDLVYEEEHKDFSTDIIDVLLIILAVQKNKVNFAQVLDFLEFTFFDTMTKGEFHLTYKLLKNIDIIRRQLKTNKPWIIPLLDNFMHSISAKDKFADVSWVRDADCLRQHTPNLENLWPVLRILAPEIIFTLGPLAGRIQVDNVHVRNELIEILESKAKDDPDKLYTLMAGSDAQVNLLLAPVLRNLLNKDAGRIYLQMTHHSSADVRKVGIDGYMMTESNPDFEKLFHLLGDEDLLVRDRIMTYLVNAGAETAEEMLIRFLGQPAMMNFSDEKHIFEYYRALASCGSDKSLPFLERTLLDSKISDMFSNSNAVHKKGAALALKAIGSDGAIVILQKGAKSIRPDIRLACQNALNR